MTDRNEMVAKLALAALQGKPVLLATISAINITEEERDELVPVSSPGPNWTLAWRAHKWYFNGYEVSRSDALGFFTDCLNALNSEVDV